MTLIIPSEKERRRKPEGNNLSDISIVHASSRLSSAQHGT
jgi:hypothetical protein